MDGDFTNSEKSRGKKIMNSPLLSDQGRRWLLRAVDPFHDTQVKPEGYPDFDMSGTVVQEINMTLNVSAPASAGTGNWDCHIFNLADFAAATGTGGLNPVTYNPTTGQLGSGTPFAFAAAGLQILTGKPGAQMLPDSGSGVIDASTTQQSLNPISFIASKCRVVGAGFEVHNTTSSLYKQGTITAYRNPQMNNLVLVNVVGLDQGGTNVQAMVPFRSFALPPSTVGEALALPASKQWEAAEGYYGVLTQMDNENVMQNVENVGRIYLAKDDWHTALDTPISALVSYFNLTEVGGVFSSTWSTQYYHPYNTSGCYLTGLSNQTTLQINLKLLLESAPGPRSPLVTLASPSPNYDPEAIRLYSQLVEHLPVGVPVGMNPAGEWFGTILGTLGSLANMAGAINPLFSVLGTGLTVASKWVPGITDAIGNTYASQAPKELRAPRVPTPLTAKGAAKRSAAKGPPQVKVRPRMKRKV